MYTIDDIKLGSIYKYDSSASKFTMEVIEINMNGKPGNTKLIIIESDTKDQWFQVGHVFEELLFVNHWNDNIYALIKVPELKPIRTRLELIA